MLVQRKLLIGQIGQRFVQVELALLVLTHQIAHDQRQGLQVVIRTQGLFCVDRRHQFAGSFTQGIDGPGTAGQLITQACVALGQFNRTQLQAACLEFQVPIALLVRFVDTLQQRSKPLQYGQHIRRQASHIGLLALHQQRCQAVFENAEFALDLPR